MKLHTSWEEREKEHRIMNRRRGWGKGWKDEAKFSWSLLRPGYWGNWLAVGALWLIVTVLPYRAIMALGSLVGHLLARFMPARKYVTDRNLELAFPEMSKAERDALSHQIFAHSGQAIFETAIAWFWSDRRLLSHSTVDPEELAAARELAATGTNTVVLTAHFITLEIMARLYALYVKPGIGVYRSSDHPLWEYIQVKGRLRNNVALVDRNDPRSIIRALKMGYPIWYAPDQDYGRRVSIFVPFFAVAEAATITGPHDLARVSNTVVQPSWTIRRDGRYVLRLGKPLADFPSDDVHADTRRCNEVIENMIREAPEQYLWIHRRFKTAPEGTPSRYPKLD